MSDHEFGFKTRSLHAGGRPDPATGARAVPIYQSTSFVFEDTADAADLFALLLGIIVCGVLVWYGGKVTWAKFITNEYDFFKIDDVPIYIILIVIPLGSLAFLIQLLLDAYRLLRTPAVKPADDSIVDL